ncbi:PO6F2 factor, partial [Dicaeum eximium]|nr:PO6F2 factor [Dicaeum eximium]
MDHLVPTPCHGQRQLSLDQVSQSLIQPGLGTLPGMGHPQLPWLTCSCHPHSKKFLPNISSKPPLPSLKPFPLVLSWIPCPTCPCKTVPILVPLYVLGGCCKLSPEHSLFQTEHPQLFQPAFTGEMLQPSDHLCGLLWTCEVPVLLMLKTTELEAALHVGLMRAEQKRTYTSPKSSDTAQDAVGLQGCKEHVARSHPLTPSCAYVPHHPSKGMTVSHPQPVLPVSLCFYHLSLIQHADYKELRVASICGMRAFSLCCFFQIIGTIPLMPNPVPSSQAAGGAQGLQVQPITPQLLTNAQGQIIATVIGNQILPVINTQGITLSPLKPGQQLHQPSQTQVGQAASQSNLLHLAHSQASMSQSPVRQASSSSSSSSSSSALSVGQLVSNPQTATGEVDGVNLEEIREFAKAFKIRRLSLGLTQTQVGQALSATEGPAYSQSAICRHTILRSHFFLPQEAQENTIASSLTAKLNPGLLYPARFEKLDITPKSAQKIKPVLERWMAEAEARHRAGMQNLTEFIGSEPSKKRKRRTSFTPQALEILNAHFEKNTHPSGQEMTEIAEKLNYDREVVRVWFCNKRQALKNTIKRLKQHEPATAVPMEPLTDSLEENS